MVILKGKWNTFQSSKHEMVMEIDSLPKLNSFFCFELELGIKIFSLGLTFLGHFPPSMILASFAGSFNNTFLWILYLPVLVNVYAFGLAVFSLQWNKTGLLLIPAIELAPIWSLFSLIYVMVAPVLELYQGTGDRAFIVALYSFFLIPLCLLYSSFLAYYWVGLMTLYSLKKPSGQSSLEIDPPTTSINEGECAARDKMNIEVINEIQCLQQQDLTQIYPDLEMEESTKGF